ncbi:hypothetical protein FOZ63_025694, partial [Perkinsus olseni]
QFPCFDTIPLDVTTDIVAERRITLCSRKGLCRTGCGTYHRSKEAATEFGQLSLRQEEEELEGGTWVELSGVPTGKGGRGPSSSKDMMLFDITAAISSGLEELTAGLVLFQCGDLGDSTEAGPARQPVIHLDNVEECPHDHGLCDQNHLPTPAMFIATNPDVTYANAWHASAATCRVTPRD